MSFVDTMQAELYPWLPRKQEKRGFPQQTHNLKINISLSKENRIWGCNADYYG